MNFKKKEKSIRNKLVPVPVAIAVIFKVKVKMKMFKKRKTKEQLNFHQLSSVRTQPKRISALNIWGMVSSLSKHSERRQSK